MALNYATYPNITDLNFSNGTITTLWNYGNTATGGFASPAFIFILAAVVFFAAYNPNRAGRAVTASAMVSFLTSIVFMGAGILHPMWVLVTVSYLLIGLYLASKDSSF